MNDVQFRSEAEYILQKYFNGKSSKFAEILNHLSYDRTIDSFITEFHNRDIQIKGMETELKNNKELFESIMNIPQHDKSRIENLAKYLIQLNKSYLTLMNQ